MAAVVSHADAEPWDVEIFRWVAAMLKIAQEDVAALVATAIAAWLAT